MKVIIDKDGVSAHSVNDKAQISHEVAQKVSLSKRNDGVISNKNVRSVSGDKTADKVPEQHGSPSAAARRKEFFSNKSPQLATNQRYKVLKNGVVGNNEITKRKMRTISSKKAAKLKKAKLKKLKKQQKRFNREQAQLIGIAMYGFAPSKKTDLTKAVANVKKVSHIIGKPVESLKRQFYSQADKSEDNGIKAYKLEMQIKEYGTTGVKTAIKSGVKTAKITKRVYRKLHKPTSAELRRKLQKRVNHNLAAEAKFLAKRAIKNGTRAAGKAAANAAKATAKASAKAAAKAAQAAAKAAQAAAKAVASAAAKVAGLIAETMPWSLIVIVVIVLVLLIVLMFGSMFTSAGGSVAGGGAWLVDDNKNETPEEIYEGYKEFVEQAKDVMETQAKQALKDDISSFCNSDTTVPRKIIQYIDKNNNILRYPASGADSTINALINNFGTDDYADYMSLLFVLMTREKQQADGVTDAEIYDFDFQKSDFEEFMKTVNENSCRWGDTFVIKTAEETSGNTCPGEQCRRKKIAGCKCASYVDDKGKVHEYCGGHCPNDHIKLTAKIYTVKDYYGKEYPEIYNFTENEKTRYEASKAIIQGMIDYWEGGSN